MKHGYTISGQTVGRDVVVDMMKMILSVLVVFLHAEVKIGFLYPFLHAAVPLFFMTSGYYFFRKVGRAENPVQRRAVLGKFLKRNMILYAVWFVALLPITLYIRDWFSGSFLNGLRQLVLSFLFNSTFRGSWYIMALNIGVMLVYWASLKLKTQTLLAITLPVYLICCLFSNYYGLVEDNAVVVDLYEEYLSVFQSLTNSYPAGLLWIVLGKYFSERDVDMKKAGSPCFIAVFAVVLVLEYLLITVFELGYAGQAYLSLIPFCVAVFCCVMTAKITIGSDYRFGNASTIIYVTHASILTVMRSVFRRMLPLTGELQKWAIILVTMIVCLVICWVVFTLERKKGFRWMRYAY